MAVWIASDTTIGAHVAVSMASDGAPAMYPRNTHQPVVAPAAKLQQDAARITARRQVITTGPSIQPSGGLRTRSELAGPPSGGSCSSLFERDHRHGPQQDRAALLVDLKKGFTVKAEGASGFSRQGHSPVWAHGNYASHAPTSIRGATLARSNRPIVKLPLDRLANHPLSSALVMSRSVLANWYVKGTATAAVVPCPEREARIRQQHEFAIVRSQARWMSALRFTPQG
jgi:hypothetical protein